MVIMQIMRELKKARERNDKGNIELVICVYEESLIWKNMLSIRAGIVSILKLVGRKIEQHLAVVEKANKIKRNRRKR